MLLPIWDQGNYASLSVYFSPFISMANFYSTNMADGDPTLSIGTTFSGFFCQVFCQKVRLFFYRYSFLGVRACDLSCFCRSLAKIRNIRKMLPSNSWSCFAAGTTGVHQEFPQRLGRGPHMASPGDAGHLPTVHHISWRESCCILQPSSKSLISLKLKICT